MIGILYGKQKKIVKLIPQHMDRTMKRLNTIVLNIISSTEGRQTLISRYTFNSFSTSFPFYFNACEYSNWGKFLARERTSVLTVNSYQYRSDVKIRDKANRFNTSLTPRSNELSFHLQLFHLKSQIQCIYCKSESQTIYTGYSKQAWQKSSAFPCQNILLPLLEIQSLLIQLASQALDLSCLACNQKGIYSCASA